MSAWTLQRPAGLRMMSHVGTASNGSRDGVMGLRKFHTATAAATHRAALLLPPIPTKTRMIGITSQRTMPSELDSGDANATTAARRRGPGSSREPGYSVAAAQGRDHGSLARRHADAGERSLWPGAHHATFSFAYSEATFSRWG